MRQVWCSRFVFNRLNCAPDFGCTVPLPCRRDYRGVVRYHRQSSAARTSALQSSTVACTPARETSFESNVSCRFAVRARLAALFAASSFAFSASDFVRGEENTPKDTLAGVVSSEECGILEAMVQDAATVFLGFVDTPDDAWDEKKVVWRGTPEELTIFAKKVPGSNVRAFLARARFVGTSLQEFVLSVEPGAGTRRASWDTAVERLDMLLSFDAKLFKPVSSDAPRPAVSVSRTYTHPALLGLVSKRVADDIGVMFCRCPGREDSIVNFVLGVESPLVDQTLQDAKLGQKATALVERLRKELAASHDGSRVVMMNHVTGIMVTEVGPDTLLVNYLIHSDASGGLPTWAMDKGVSQVLVDIFKNVRADVKAQRKIPLEERLRGRTRWPTLPQRGC